MGSKPFEISLGPPIEKTRSDPGHGDQPAHNFWASWSDRSTPAPFIGRLGGNQAFVLNRNDPASENILQKAPDAAPAMSVKDQLDLAPFRSPGLWKAGIIEGIGEICMCILV